MTLHKPSGLILAAGFAFTILVLGCDNRHILGSVNGGSSGGEQDSSFSGTGGGPTSGGGGSGVPRIVDAAAQPEVGMLGPLESWSGYIENSQFASGSDAVKLKFGIDPAGLVGGTIVFGSGTPPPPATDPNVGYPPGVDVFAATGIVMLEGFPYSIQQGTLAGQRLRVLARREQLWDGWCALQIPADAGGLCLPNWGFSGDPNRHVCSQTNPANGQVVAVDCNKLHLCLQEMICSCTPATCSTNPNSGGVSFDVSITGTTASGSIAGILGEHNVHLTKDP